MSISHAPITVTDADGTITVINGGVESVVASPITTDLTPKQMANLTPEQQVFVRIWCRANGLDPAQVLRIRILQKPDGSAYVSEVALLTVPTVDPEPQWIAIAQSVTP